MIHWRALVVTLICTPVLASVFLTPPAPPSIEFCFPSTQTLYAGQVISVQWKSTNLYFPSTVNIDMFVGGMFNRSVAVNAPNNGSTTWVVDAHTPALSNVQLRIESVQNKTAFNTTGLFSIAHPNTVTQHPLYSTTPQSFGDFGQDYFDGIAFDRFYKGQRCMSLFYGTDFGVSSSTSALISSLTVNVASVPTLDIENFKIHYQKVTFQSIPSQYFSDFEPTLLFEISTLSVSSMTVGQSVTFNFSAPVQLSQGQNVLFEISSSSNTNSFTSTSRVAAVAVTGSSASRTLRGFSNDWFGLPYPYSNLDGQVGTSAFTNTWVMDLSFQTQLLNPPAACGAQPTLLTTPIVEYTWQLTQGTSNFEVDCTTAKAQGRPECRSGATVELDSYGDAYMFGGTGTNFQEQISYGDLWLYSNGAWKLVLDTGCNLGTLSPQCRSGHASASVDSKMVVLGGRYQESLNFENNEQKIWTMDMSLLRSLLASSTGCVGIFCLSDAWQSRETCITPRRGHAMAVGSDNFVYVYGGLTASGYSNRLASIQTPFPSTKKALTSNYFDGASFVSCGSGNTCTDAVCNTLECQPAPGNPPCVSHHTLVHWGGSLYLFGGQTGNVTTATSSATNALWRFDLSAKNWTQVTAHNCELGGFTQPQCRYSHSAEVRGNSMIIYGGGSSVFTGNDVWEFSFTTSSWVQHDVETCLEVSTSTGGRDSSRPPCSSGQAMMSRGGTSLTFMGQRTLPGVSFYLNSVWSYGRTPYVLTTQSLLLPASGNVVATVKGLFFGTNTSQLSVLVNGDVVCGMGTAQPITIVKADEEISCTFPPGSGVGNTVTVRITEFGQWNSNSPAILAYIPPTITGVVIPASNPTQGGATVTVNGQNFGPTPPSGSVDALYVTIGTTRCATTTHVSENQVLCLTAEGVGQNLPITITVKGQTSAVAAQTYSYSGPVITNLAHDTSSTDGTTVLTITGTNFGPASLLINALVGGQACTSLTHVSHTQVLCTVPPGVGADNSVVVIVDGEISTNNAGNFNYAPPTITSVLFLPSSTSGNGTLTVYGANFGPSASAAQPQVLLGPRPCSSTQWFGNAVPQYLVCNIPPGVGSDVPITVRIGNQQTVTSSPSLAFSYASPEIVSITPNAFAIKKPEQVMSISGNNFGSNVGLIYVQIGDIANCTDLTLASDHSTLTCRIPQRDEEQTALVTVYVAGQASQAVPITYEILAFDSTTVLIFDVAAGVILFGLVLLALALTFHRGSVVIKAASLLFLYIIVFGAVLTISSIFLWPFQRQPMCVVPIWMLVLGFTLVYGTLVLKNYRILALFQNTQIARNLISDYKLLGYLFLLLAVDVGLLFGYSNTDSCVIPEDSTASMILILILASKVLLVIAGLVIAFKSRVIHIKEFDERHELGYAIYNVAIFLVIFVPINVTFANDDQEVFVLRSIAVLFITLSTLLVLFVPKFFHLHALENEGSQDNNMPLTRSITTRQLTYQRSNTSLLSRRAGGGRGGRRDNDDEVTEEDTVELTESPSKNIARKKRNRRQLTQHLSQRALKQINGTGPLPIATDAISNRSGRSDSDVLLEQNLLHAQANAHSVQQRPNLPSSSSHASVPAARRMSSMSGVSTVSFAPPAPVGDDDEYYNPNSSDMSPGNGPLTEPAEHGMPAMPSSQPPGVPQARASMAINTQQQQEQQQQAQQPGSPVGGVYNSPKASAMHPSLFDANDPPLPPPPSLSRRI